MNIRNARVSDLNRMLEIYSIARDYMKANGNANQWGDIRIRELLSRI